MLVRTLGPGKAQVEVSADLNADKTTQRRGRVREEGHAAQEVDRDREAQGRRRRPPAAPRAPARTSPLTPPARPAAARTRTTSARPRAPTSASARRSCAPRSPPARSRRSTSRCSWTSPSRPPTSPPSSRPSPAPRASTPSAVTRCRPRRCRSPRSPTPKAGPLPTSLLGPLKWVGIGIADAAVPVLHEPPAEKREGETLASPAWLSEIEEPVSLAELEQQTQVMGARNPDDHAPAARPGHQRSRRSTS